MVIEKGFFEDKLNLYYNNNCYRYNCLLGHVLLQLSNKNYRKISSGEWIHICKNSISVASNVLTLNNFTIIV